MAKKNPLTPQEIRPGFKPGTYRGLGVSGQTALDSATMKDHLQKFERILTRAEDKARRNLKLGPYSNYRHPNMSLKWGNTVDNYAKEDFLSSKEGKSLQKAGWKWTPRGKAGADFYHEGMKVAVDPCGSSPSSVNSHRKYSKGGFGVIVRTSAPTGGMKVFNMSGGKRIAGRAHWIAAVVDLHRNKQKVIDDAGLGVHFLPFYRLWEGKRPSPDLMMLFDIKAARKKCVFDKRLFRANLERLPKGTILPLEYPVERTGAKWISDVTSKERTEMLNRRPGEYLVWRKSTDDWHLSRSKRHYTKPTFPTPKPIPAQTHSACLLQTPTAYLSPVSRRALPETCRSVSCANVPETKNPSAVSLFRASTAYLSFVSRRALPETFRSVACASASETKAPSAVGLFRASTAYLSPFERRALP